MDRFKIKINIIYMKSIKTFNEYIFEKLNPSAKTLLMGARKYLDHTDRRGVPILSPREKYELYYIFKDLVKKCGKEDSHSYYIFFDKKLYGNYRIGGLYVDKEDDALKIRTYWGDELKEVYWLELFERKHVNISRQAQIKLEDFMDYLNTVFIPNVL